MKPKHAPPALPGDEENTPPRLVVLDDDEKNPPPPPSAPSPEKEKSEPQDGEPQDGEPEQPKSPSPSPSESETRKGNEEKGRHSAYEAPPPPENPKFHVVKNSSGNIAKIDCESFEDFVALARKLPDCFKGKEHGWSNQSEGGFCSRTVTERLWSGTSNFDEACQLALRGWPEGREHAERYLIAIESIIGMKTFMPTPEFSVHGGGVDVGRFMGSDPECMVSRKPEERDAPSRIVTIVFNAAISGSESPEVLIQKGAVACAMIDKIESLGLRVECHVTAGSIGQTKDGARKIELSYLLKKAEEPLELDRIIFALAHPAAFRRLMFSLYEHAGVWEFDRHGYGRPCATSLKGDIIIREICTYGSTPEDAVKWIAEQLKQVGIEIETTNPVPA